MYNSKLQVQRPKYGNKKTVVDGIEFDSLWEAKRYGQLKLLLAAGEISNLRLQVKFPILINGVKVCTYIADFVYIDLKKTDVFGNAVEVVEDAKGFETETFRLKKKLMKAVYGVEIYLSRANKTKKTKTIKSPKRQKKANGKDPQH